MNFDYSEKEDEGAISYLIKHNKNIPSYIRNQNIKENYSFNPKYAFSHSDFSNSFDTQLNQKPFIIINIFPYLIKPKSYKFSVVEGGSPPVLWEFSGSNNGDEWISLSTPPQNNQLCPNGTDPSMIRVCGSTEVVLYDTIETQDKYRYFKFTVLKDRNKEYNPSAKAEIFRVGIIDIFGTLYKEFLFTHQSFHPFYSLFIKLLITIFINL